MINIFSIRIGLKTAALLGTCWVTWELGKHFHSLDGAGMATLFFTILGILTFAVLSVTVVVSLIEDIRNRIYQLEFQDEED